MIKETSKDTFSQQLISEIKRWRTEIILDLHTTPLNLSDCMYVAAFITYCIIICLLLVKLKTNSDNKRKLQRTKVYNSDVCPICLSELMIPVRISCGHAYCASCIIKYFEYILKRGKVECPMCKETIKEAKLLNTSAMISIGDAYDVQMRIKKLLEKAKIIQVRRSIRSVTRKLRLVYRLLEAQNDF
nr:zinc-binding protein A33 [Onthophagus taurus]